MTAIPRAPTSSGAAGRRLWRAALTDFELAAHEQVLLRRACRVADVCEGLQHRVDEEGPLVTTRLGEQRAHPAVELRQQRLVLARLIVALRVPLGDQEPEAARTAYRGLRGVYGGAA
jgi:hypothetical protein